MIELSHRHLGTDILAHGDHRNTKNGERLERIVGFLVLLLLILVIVLLPLHTLSLLLLLEGIKVLAAQVQQSLHPQDVPGGNEGAHLHKNLCLP